MLFTALEPFQTPETRHWLDHSHSEASKTCYLLVQTRYLPLRRHILAAETRFYCCGAILRPQKRVIGWSTTILKLPNHDICRSGAILNPLKPAIWTSQNLEICCSGAQQRTFLCSASQAGQPLQHGSALTNRSSHGKTFMARQASGQNTRQNA